MSASGLTFVCVVGSLFSEKSRSLTGLSGRTFPVIVNDYERSWCCRIEGIMTALGMVPTPGRAVNAALVEIPVEELPRFDDREGAEYERLPLPWESFSPYSPEHQLPPEGEVFYYRPVNPCQPNPGSPILASYVSVCLDGILSDAEYSPMSFQFAVDFLQSTRNWQFFCNDSAAPRYVRHLKSTPHQDLIARLIKENLPAEAFVDANP